MANILGFIESIKNDYDNSQFPFLRKQLKRVEKNRPYQGLKLLHNIPFTRETILKLEILFAGGADVTVTSPSFMKVDPDLVNRFVEAGGNWLEKVDSATPSFDICLDCAGELLGKCNPRIGTVEITGTGTNKYRDANINYPVISVDQSRIKNLEGILGTGEAFVRAFKELSRENIKDKQFMIFGYGKVGKGIVHYLKEHTKNITVVDKISSNINQVKELGFTGILADDKDAIEKSATETFAVVTATGIRNAISDNYDTNAFKGRYLANMGGEDEFGYSFDSKEVMCEKKPINFFIDRPTLMRYLDPVFYAHNLGIDLLQFANLPKGLHPFPQFLSDQVVTDWENIFHETIKI